ncbi:beta-phosphoglucomutase family hydrolase [Noviherbaspirillum autotrophicum]|uniref:beta-phosphoglucomutase family hydrolase n=1 Tax=Noviherbaspirillum autotrophicum TaxID=709839 RepID=UPI000B12E65D
MTTAPFGLQAAIFDMDGVITRTAQLHASAWKETFDDFLQQRAMNGAAFRPFDEHSEYRAYVDGKPRREGVHSFLRARGIASSEAEEETLAARKDTVFERLLHAQGVQTFPSTLALVAALREKGVKIAVVTSSKHGREVLQSAGITTLFDAHLDGLDLEQLGLKGKPEPDMFLHAAAALGSAPGRALVVEDATSGVEAARKGRFGLVVGIDRGGNASALQRAGADLVVRDLAEIDSERLDAAFRTRLEEIAWRIEQEGFDRSRERQMESLFAIGNGYMGVRGALDSPLPISQCDLFIAGVYDGKRADLPYSEIEFLTPERGADPYAELVPLPFPFGLTISIDNELLDFTGEYGRGLRRVLELRRGILHCEAMYETPGERRTTVRTRRCASLADPHLLLQEAVIDPENHWATVECRTFLKDPDLAEHRPHLEQLDYTNSDDMECVLYATRLSGVRICIVSRIMRGPNLLRRAVSVFTSRDQNDPVAAALAHAKALKLDQFELLLSAHADLWAAFWRQADIRVPGRAAVEQALRFNAYHLRLPANEDPRTSVGARTLSGRAYEGHVFWDTEIFMLPFYLHVEPPLARNLLLYRHHTLDGARRRARELGYRGACFAWESTVTGSDVTPSRILIKSTGREIPIFTGTQQVHVTADIAYAVWRYWEATQDEDFIAGPGAELLYETARFWASRVTPGERHHHIRGVVGPDEYHHSVNDNAYTNWMARFNLERAAWMARQAGANMPEADEWEALAQSLYLPAPDERGIIEQFEGFFGLDDYVLTPEERLRTPASRLFDWERINRIKLLKQADVLMLPLLFPESFSDEIVAANYRYYEPLTDHGSSLSPSVHAAIAARIGLREHAQRYWEQSLWLDLSNAMDNSMLGVHPAAMGGTWQALVFGFLGLRFTPAGPEVDARAAERLPADWESVQLNLMYRGSMHTVKVNRANGKEAAS